MQITRRKALLGAALLLTGASLPRPSANPTVNWSNPMAYGLTGVYFTGRGSKIIYDLTGKGASPVCGTSGVFKPTQEGYALDTSAQGGGQGCNAVATAAQQPTKTASIFWRGVLLGTPASNEYLFGVEFGDGNSTPFDAYDLVYLASGSVQGGCSTVAGGSFAATVAVTANVLIDLATTVDASVTGNLNVYKNGAFASTTAVNNTSTINYGTNPQLQIGSTNNAGQNAANARHLVAYTWSRVLSATEIQSLHNDPYQLLRFPEDGISGTVRW